MKNNDIIFWGLLMAMVATLAFFIFSKTSTDKEPTFTLSPSPSESSVPSPTPTPILTQTPKPKLIIEEKRTYRSWFDELDPENRVLAVYEECAYLVPSNLSYKNNTLVMLDNTRSSQGQILKIGEQNYSLSAGEWYMITLYSKTVPIDLGIFCKNVELGSIRLE
jgi:hypothetical protein